MSMVLEFNTLLAALKVANVKPSLGIFLHMKNGKSSLQ